MLIILGAVFLLLWLVGLISSKTFGGALHVLLVIALICFIARAIA